MRCCPRLGGRALAIDLPGHGEDLSPVGSFRTSLRDILQGLPDAVDQVAGYSLGGRFALGLIAANPTRFSRALIVSAHPGLTDHAERARRMALEREWIIRLRSEGIEAFVRAWEAQPLFSTQTRLPEAVMKGQRAQRLRQRAEGLAQSLEQHGLARMPSLWGSLARFPGQLDWIVGSADRKFLAIAREVARRRASTRLRILPGIGHNPLLECPEILAECID